MSRRKKNKSRARSGQMELPAATKDRRPRILVLEGLAGASDCVRDAGGLPVKRSPYTVKTYDALKLQWDALLLTGGGDLDPRLYGAKKRHAKVYGVNETRDAVELAFLDEARDRNVPVLGICRGSQLICVHGGGTLKQHIEGHRGGKHRIVTARGSIIRKAAPQEGKRVVSLHHQEMATCGEDYTFSAAGLDGTIESVESLDGRCLGVQFHPEMDELKPYAQGIFRWLVLEAAQRAGLPAPRKPRPRPFGTVAPGFGKRLAARPAGSQKVPGRATRVLCDRDGTELRVGDYVRYKEAPVKLLVTDVDASQFEPIQIEAPSRQRARTVGPNLLVTGHAELTPETMVAALEADEHLNEKVKSRRMEGVQISWLCPHCSLRFTYKDDRNDHVRTLHRTKGSPVLKRS